MNKDLETQVLEYEERTFAFNENAGRVEQDIADKIISPVEIVRSIIRYVSGRSAMDIPLVGGVPAETFLLPYPKTTIAAGATGRLKGAYAHRVTEFGIWNFDTTNSLLLDIGSQDGGGRNITIPPNFYWEKRMSLSPDTELVLTNNNASGVAAQMYLLGW